ncbi:MAG: hypothetical protein A2289_05805 [Deltaproteobacteria bacterium RIFOXYA12_FULL_58_15]|nr:MAG: hypothetical protein A2289_05805 [Deltaproteobacteria bacterium RIFOXYA12_FULL_58_15]
MGIAAGAKRARQDAMNTVYETDEIECGRAMSRPTRILLNITHGFQARMLLRSGISERLARHARLIVVSPNANEPYFSKEFSNPQICLEPTPQLVPTPVNKLFNRLEGELLGVRQYWLMSPALGKTLNIKNETFRRLHPYRWLVSRIGNQVFGRSPLFRQRWQHVERSCFPGREFDAVLTAHRPDLVVTGTPGVDPRDAHLVRAAHRHRITTATVMLSWDNLTSKGYVSDWPNHLLVWSDLMAEEAIHYHGFPRGNIHWCGAAQFDHYSGFREAFDRDTWRKAHGVPTDAGLIVYGTINPAIMPHELEVVREIVSAVRGKRFSRPVYLWIRLHPQIVKGVYARSLEPYLQLGGPDVHVEVPPVQSGQLAWDLPKADSQHLASLLAAADIVATPCSTLVIDAACVGTPSINVFFDGPNSVAQEWSARRFEVYTHYAKLIATGGIHNAYSLDDFIRLANRSLNGEISHTEGLRAIVEQQLNRLDGNAGARTADMLLKLARQSEHESR